MSAEPDELGPYVIYERLGAGGMATVHRADQVGVAGFRRPVALKRLLPSAADEPVMVEMFIHEARLASQLRHANVAATYDLGKVDDTYFIAMEYVPGPTLTRVMKQCLLAAGRMPIPVVLAILSQLCDALDHAHNLCDDIGTPLGIIHRDVSPSNIIVSTTGLVKLIDFGIAKAATGGAKTQTGMIKGKFAYIAPEYMEGQLDLRADMFGVGIIAHELLSMRRLFNAASDFETLKRLREMAIPPPSRFNPDVPADLDDIVLLALKRNPDERWQSASAMRTALVNVARNLEGGALTNQQIAEWVEWALVQPPRKNLAERLDRAASISVTGDNDVTSHRLTELEDLEYVYEDEGDPDDEDEEDELAEPPMPTVAGRARTPAPRAMTSAETVTVMPSAPAADIPTVVVTTDAVAALPPTDDNDEQEDEQDDEQEDEIEEKSVEIPIDVAEEEVVPRVRSFVGNETGEVVVVAPRAATAPPAEIREPRRWPWIVLALTVLLGIAGALAYVIGAGVVL